MNITHLHDSAAALSVKSLFKTDTCQARSIFIKKGEELKEHISPVTALLVCTKGKVFYSEVTGLEKELSQNDYLEIPLQVRHKLKGLEDAELLLFS